MAPTHVVTITVRRLRLGYEASAALNGETIAMAIEARELRAVRSCLEEAEKYLASGRSGRVYTYKLPYCGKKFDVPWWDEPAKVSFDEEVELRSKWRKLREDSEHESA